MFLDHFKDLPDHRQAGDVSYPARGDPAFDAVAVNTRRSEHDDALAGVFHSSRNRGRTINALGVDHRVSN
jgi:hypothetical protein